MTDKSIGELYQRVIAEEAVYAAAQKLADLDEKGKVTEVILGFSESGIELRELLADGERYRDLEKDADDLVETLDTQDDDFSDLEDFTPEEEDEPSGVDVVERTYSVNEYEDGELTEIETFTSIDDAMEALVHLQETYGKSYVVVPSA